MLPTAVSTKKGHPLDLKEARIDPITDFYKDARVRLHQKFEQSRNDILKDNFLTKILTSSFGGRGLAAGEQPYLDGFVRPKDELVVSQVINKIIQKQGNEPVRILELAAGRTYAHYAHFGAPWLSRILKRSFGDLVEITLSDKDESIIQVFMLDQKSQIHSTLVMHLPEDIEKFFSAHSLNKNDGGHTCLTFTVNNWVSLRKNAPRFAAEIEEILRIGAERAFLPEKGKEQSTHIFIRPGLDAEFEKAHFNLEVKTKVTFESLPYPFQENNFDITFCRHLTPICCFQRDQITQKAESVLTPSGVAIINIAYDRSF